MTSSSYPNTAHVLSLIGGILIVLGGLVEAAAGAFRTAVFVGLGIVGAFAIVLGLVGIAVGLVILYGALQLKSRPQSAKTWGVLIIVLSFVSFLGGDGFLIGLVLSLIGGILAAIWNPPSAPMGETGPWGQPQGGTSWGQPTMGSPGNVGGAALAGSDRRFCSSCGAANVPSASFCAKCGAPMTR